MKNILNVFETKYEEKIKNSIFSLMILNTSNLLFCISLISTLIILSEGSIYLISYFIVVLISSTILAGYCLHKKIVMEFDILTYLPIAIATITTGISVVLNFEVAGFLPFIVIFMTICLIKSFRMHYIIIKKYKNEYDEHQIFDKSWKITTKKYCYDDYRIVNTNLNLKITRSAIYDMKDEYVCKINEFLSFMSALNVDDINKLKKSDLDSLEMYII